MNTNNFKYSQTKLCLGTAQFGMNYGITNKSGQVQSDEIKKILRLSSLLSISYIDTAQAYGNAEKAIGEQIPWKNDFQIISKLPPQGRNLKGKK